MEKRIVLINPVMRWGVEPGHQETIKYIDGVAGVATSVPEIGDVLTLPFMVDPATGTPCPVRVTRIEHIQEPNRTIVVPVVVRATQD